MCPRAQSRPGSSQRLNPLGCPQRLPAYYPYPLKSTSKAFREIFITDGSADQEVIDEVIAMIREWRFEAALRDDKPVISDAHIDFSGRPRAYKIKPQQ
jgi:hypothetical protein